MQNLQADAYYSGASGLLLHIPKYLFPPPLENSSRLNMKAAVVHPGGKIKYETVADPAIKNSGDAIIKSTSTASCKNSNPDFYGPEGTLLKEKGGGIFGYTDLYSGYDGGQAEYARVPYADFGPRIVPENLTDDQALFLTDIFPTGYNGIDWGEVKGGQAPVHKHIDQLLKYVVEGKVQLDDIITHRLPLSEVEHAYHIFRHKEEDCVKVVLKP